MRGAAANYVPACLNSLTAPPVRIPTRGTTRTQKHAGRTLARTASRPEGHLDVRRASGGGSPASIRRVWTPSSARIPTARRQSLALCVCVCICVCVSVRVLKSDCCNQSTAGTKNFLNISGIRKDVTPPFFFAIGSVSFCKSTAATCKYRKKYTKNCLHLLAVEKNARGQIEKMARIKPS